MLNVNNAVPTTVSYYPSDTNTQAAPMAETHADSTSELNTKLIKELIAQLDTPNKADKFDEIREQLGQYGLDTSGEDFYNSKLLAALERLKTSNDVAEMVANQEQRVKSSSQALSDIQSVIVTNRIKTNYSLSQFLAEKQRAVQEAATESTSGDDGITTYTSRAVLEAATVSTSGDEESTSGDDGISTHTSYAELWARIALAISGIKSDYVDFYADLMQKYTEMYEAYNTYVLGAASTAVSSGDDANNVTFDTSVMETGYDDFMNEVNGIDLGSVTNWDEMTEEERESMETTLAPAFSIDDSGEISFNLDQYSAASDYPSGISDGQVSTVGYQAWLASFNAVGSALQSNMQAFAQRYTQANSTFDNLNKVLSGAIDSLAESAKAVLEALV